MFSDHMGKAKKEKTRVSLSVSPVVWIFLLGLAGFALVYFELVAFCHFL